MKVVNESLEKKLKSLPLSSGVYFHKSKTGEIIYVGKAAVLKNRVRQYFQSSRDFDVKTKALVAEIHDTDWIETESEIDALFLEGEMVKRYMPRFNILLRDDKSQLFVRIDMKSDRPVVAFTRNPADDGAEYFGPYFNGFAVKKAFRYLRKIFPHYTKPNSVSNRPDLDVHLGLSPSPDLSSSEYKLILKKLIQYIKGNRKTLILELEKEMKQAAGLQDFETAASLRNKIRNLKELQRRIMFGDKEFLDISKDRALGDLRELLGLKEIPARIEGYDVSHMSGTNVVASMVVFSNGTSDRSEYRKFKTRIDQNNDFFNMNETISRRLSAKNLKSWGKPDLILIDGGKGQLDAALTARDDVITATAAIDLAEASTSSLQGATLQREKGETALLQGGTLQNTLQDASQNGGQGGVGRLAIPFVGLAKREEQIVIDISRSGVLLNMQKLAELDGRITTTENFILINLPHNTHIIKLLQRIRDESHRFAVSYHTTLKRNNATKSILEEIPGIGPVLRKKLIKNFGSVRALKDVPESKIAEVVGPKKAAVIARYISS